MEHVFLAAQSFNVLFLVAAYVYFQFTWKNDPQNAQAQRCSLLERTEGNDVSTFLVGGVCKIGWRDKPTPMVIMQEPSPMLLFSVFKKDT